MPGWPGFAGGEDAVAVVAAASDDADAVDDLAAAAGSERSRIEDAEAFFDAVEVVGTARGRGRAGIRADGVVVSALDDGAWRS